MNGVEVSPTAWWVLIAAALIGQLGAIFTSVMARRATATENKETKNKLAAQDVVLGGIKDVADATKVVTDETHKLSNNRLDIMVAKADAMEVEVKRLNALLQERNGSTAGAVRAAMADNTKVVVEAIERMQQKQRRSR